MRTTIITAFLLFITAPLCHGARLNTLSFSTGNGRFIIDAVFDNTVTYTVRAENNGAY